KFSLFQRKDTLLLFVAILCAIIPDLDVVAFYFGIPYSHIFGHRGISHSIPFALLFSSFLILLLYKTKKIQQKESWRVFFLFFLSTLSHGLTDAMTNGGLGVCFFCPFISKRYFFSYRPIKVSPIGAYFFSDKGLLVLFSELTYIVVPVFLGLYVLFIGRKIFNRRI
ncbi:MAG: metal-dependent hydrolase, partial [Leptospiraceae bacterium]|nr:metal-dependent hydrolase [Leptospiraceae bacterium]